MRNQRSFRGSIAVSALMVAGWMPVAFAEDVPASLDDIVADGGGLEGVPTELQDCGEACMFYTTGAPPEGEVTASVEDIIGGGDGLDIGEVPPELQDCGEACMFYTTGGAPEADMGASPEVNVDVGQAGGVADYLDSSGGLALDVRDAAGEGISVLGGPSATGAVPAGASGSGSTIRDGHLR